METVVPDHFVDTADLILVCSDGQELMTHGSLLCLCSPVIRGMCESLDDGRLPEKLNVQEPSDQWKVLLPYLYPNLVPTPLTWVHTCKNTVGHVMAAHAVSLGLLRDGQTNRRCCCTRLDDLHDKQANKKTTVVLGDVMELAHKYDMQHILHGCTKFLETSGNSLTCDRRQPNYVLRVLEVCSRLHLTNQQKRCVQYFKSYGRQITHPYTWYCRANGCQHGNQCQEPHAVVCQYCNVTRTEGIGCPCNDKEWLCKLGNDVLVDLLAI